MDYRYLVFLGGIGVITAALCVLSNQLQAIHKTLLNIEHHVRRIPVDPSDHSS